MLLAQLTLYYKIFCEENKQLLLLYLFLIQHVRGGGRVGSSHARHGQRGWRAQDYIHSSTHGIHRFVGQNMNDEIFLF